MGRVQCIPAVRASRLIERVLVDAGVCCGLECFVLFSLLCRLSRLSFFGCLVFFVERGEETRGRTKWPRGADTVRELAARRQHMHQPAAPSHCRGGLVIVRETIAVMYCGRQKLAFESCLF